MEVCTGWWWWCRCCFSMFWCKTERKANSANHWQRQSPASSAKQPETDREKPERARELAPLAHKKRPQDRQQTETDGERRKRQIQYQLIPSSLPKSTLPWEVTLQRERQAKPNLASTIINVMWQTHISQHLLIYNSWGQTDVYAQVTWTAQQEKETQLNAYFQNRNTYPTLMHRRKSESSPQSGQNRPGCWGHGAQRSTGKLFNDVRTEDRMAEWRGSLMAPLAFIL